MKRFLTSTTGWAMIVCVIGMIAPALPWVFYPVWEGPSGIIDTLHPEKTGHRRATTWSSGFQHGQGPALVSPKRWHCFF